VIHTRPSPYETALHHSTASRLPPLSILHHYDSAPGHHITGQCQAIRSRLRRRKRRQPTPEARDFRQDKLRWTTQREQEFGLDSSKAILAEWRARWQEEGKKKKSWWCSIAAQDQPCKNTLLLHNQLKKAESSVLVQARTGRIGLRQFLFKAKVPGVISASCPCGKGLETAEHLLLYCDQAAPSVWSRGSQFKKLISNPANTKQLARHLIQSGRLGQFKLADRLLYRQDESG
jgi:hypothetical protein